MGKRALVTGSARRVDDVEAAFVAAGFDVLAADGLEDLRRLTHELDPKSVDVFVQLPVDISSDAETVTGQIEMLLQQGILLRFRTAETVLPLLAGDARVILVPGNLPPKLSAPDDHEARVALLRVLAHALRADRAPDKLSVTVASSQHSPADLVRIAQRSSVPAPPDYAQMWPDMEYAEWRLAVLGLASLEG